MKIIQITKNFSYIPGRTNTGIIKLCSNKHLIIDTGIDDDNARKILNLLNEKKIEVQAILNTHSHADHIGGNNFIQKRTNCDIYAPQFEGAFIEAPSFEPFYLFSGAYPIKELQNKFLMAKPSKVNYKIDTSTIVISDTTIGIVDLPGHTPYQIGVSFEDVLFCSDSFFDRDTLKKHKIPYFTDISKTLSTLDILKKSSFRCYIPSHGVHSPDINESVDANISSIYEICSILLDILNGKRLNTMEIIKALCILLKVEIKNIQQYYLNNTVILAFLSYLHGNKKVGCEIDQNEVKWFIN